MVFTRPSARLNGTTRGSLGFTLALLIVSMTGASQAAEWTTYRNDNNRSGATAENLQFPLNAIWNDSAPGVPKTAWSGPDRRVIERKELRHRVRFDDAFQVVAGAGHVYFGSTVDHQLHCLDGTTGDEVWTFFTGGPIRLAPTLLKDRVLFGSDDGYVYCLNAQTGDLVWKLRASPDDEWLLARGEMISQWPIRTGVLVHQGVAYFGAGIFPHDNVFLYAVEATSGQVIWKRDNISQEQATRNDLSPQGYLLANDDLLVVPSGRSLPAVFERATGEFKHKRRPSWRREAGGVVGGTRAVLADDQIYVAGPHHMLAIDQHTGDVGGGYFHGREIAVFEGDAVMANGEAIMRVRRSEYAEASLKHQDLRMEIYSLTRKLRGAGDEQAKQELQGQIDALQKQADQLAKTGVIWQTDSTSESTIIVAGNAVIVGGEGRVEAFNAADGEPVWNAEVRGEARGLVVADGRLIVSTTTGDTYGFAHSPSSADEPAVAADEAASPFPQDEQSELYVTAAEQILANSKVNRGFCLIIGAAEGRLAYELAKRSALKIYGVEPDADKVQAARRNLSQAGLYGHRVTIHQADVADIPYSNYFANLIVSDTLLTSGKLPGDPLVLGRHLKPIGGVFCLGRPAGAVETNPTVSEVARWMEKLKSIEPASEMSIRTAGSWVLAERGRLEGSADWTHQYANAGNTATTEDRVVKGGLGVLWYGDPGPGKMVNRHEGAVGPLAVDGRLIVQGEDSVMAYDSYNGAFLWERKNPESNRTGVFKNENPGNLVAGAGRVFVLVREKCLQIDAATGEVQAELTLPESKAENYQWGYLAYQDGLLFGTATVREEIERKLRRRGKASKDSTDAIFAIDVETGKEVWTYEGQNIVHHTIALGPGRVYFIDSTISSDERAALLRDDKSDLEQLSPEEAKQAEERLKNLDVRLAVAIDAQTGEQIWSKAVDVTDCSEIGTGGGKLTLLYQNDVLLLCGANANGHYWRQFLSGEFKERRLVALSADDGHRLWAKDANYRHRPIIIEDRVIAEPWGYDLYTGAQQMRSHPLTGEAVPWSIMRDGHHCGMMTGSPGMLMFRSGFTGFYDLEENSGTRHFAGHRTGCWINAIPAGGLVMVPEASAGCVCLFSIAATIVMEPQQTKNYWTSYSLVGDPKPVKHMALNLGAPGDRQDARGNVWFAYPRPRPSKETGLDFKLDLEPTLLEGGGYSSLNAKATTIENGDPAWLFASWGRGISQYKIPLLASDDALTTYTVKLYFADLDADAKPGNRVFDVRLQGKTVLENFDVVAEAAGPSKALVREFKNISVADQLTLELTPKASDPSDAQMPILNAIEIVRSGPAGKKQAAN